MSPEGDPGPAPCLLPQQAVVEEQAGSLLHDDQIDGPQPRMQLLRHQVPPAEGDGMTLQARGPGDLEPILPVILVGQRGTVEQQEIDVVPGEVGTQRLVEALPVPTERALDDRDLAGPTGGVQGDPPLTDLGTQQPERTGASGMRIVTYHPRARVGDGGITNSVRSLSDAFARAGADPVIAYDGRGDPYREHGVEWWPVRHLGRGSVRVPSGFGGAIERADVLVLNSAWTGGNVRAGQTARRLGVPYVLAPRGAYDPLIVERRRLTKRLWWVLFERRLVASAAAMHVFFAEQSEHLGGLGYRGSVLVAPNGVRVPQGWSWDGGSGGDVAFLGRFDPEHKGIDLLLQAAALLPPEARPRLRLHGPDWRGGTARVRRLIDELDLDHDVELGPALYGDDKWSLLAHATGFAYPSRWEGFGNSLAEAAALGVPALATPYPLARYLEERDACIVADARPAALAEGLRRLCRSEAGDEPADPSDVAHDLDWDTVAGRWLDHLEGLVGGSA